MPAAAVIPAPIAYIKVVAVKKLVVGFLGTRVGRYRKVNEPHSAFSSSGGSLLALGCRMGEARRLL